MTKKLFEKFKRFYDYNISTSSKEISGYIIISPEKNTEKHDPTGISGGGAICGTDQYMHFDGIDDIDNDKIFFNIRNNSISSSTEFRSISVDRKKIKKLSCRSLKKWKDSSYKRERRVDLILGETNS